MIILSESVFPLVVLGFPAVGEHPVIHFNCLIVVRMYFFSSVSLDACLRFVAERLRCQGHGYYSNLTTTPNCVQISTTPMLVPHTRELASLRAQVLILCHKAM